MSKSFVISRRFNTNAYVEDLTKEINFMRNFKAEAQQINDNAWRIKVHDESTHGYTVSIGIENTVLSIEIAESTGSLIFNGIAAFAMTAFGVGVGLKSKNPRNSLMVRRVVTKEAKKFTNGGAREQLTRYVEKFSEKYLKNIKI